ncbi:terminase gpA endonuclease subunit [Escherichia coli]
MYRGWGPGEESWLIDRQIIMGRHDDEQTLLRVDEAINKTYTRRNGAEMSISVSAGILAGLSPTIVYERSKKHGLFRVIPIKGASRLRKAGGRHPHVSETKTGFTLPKSVRIPRKSRFITTWHFAGRG